MNPFETTISFQVTSESKLSEKQVRQSKFRQRSNPVQVALMVINPVQVALRNFYKRRRPVYGREPLVMKNLIGGKVTQLQPTHYSMHVNFISPSSQFIITVINHVSFQIKAESYTKYHFFYVNSYACVCNYGLMFF